MSATEGSAEKPKIVHPILHRLYVLLLVGLAFFLARSLTMGGLAPEFSWTDLLFFLIMIAVTEALPIELPGIEGTISVSFAMCYSAVLLFGPLIGGLLTAIGSIRSKEIRGQVPFFDVIFNRAQLFISAAMGGVVFTMIWDGGGVAGSLNFAAATMLGGVAYFSTNMLAFVVCFSLKTGAPFLPTLLGFRWAVSSYIGLLPIAYLNAAIYSTVGQIGIVVFLLPLMVGRYAFKMYRELRDVFVSTISALAAALEARDPHTSGHAERVSTYAVRIAEAMDLEADRINLLQYVSILHDMGKIGIPDHILQKPDKFDEEEWALMKQHSVIGHNILKRIHQLKQGAGWVLHHHERYDGTGYPEGLSGEDIALEARIMAAADAFDAMRSARPYKRAMTLEEARCELKRCSGTQFDPEVVDTLLKITENGDVVHASFGETSDSLDSAGEIEESAESGHL